MRPRLATDQVASECHVCRSRPAGGSRLATIQVHRSPCGNLSCAWDYHSRARNFTLCNLLSCPRSNGRVQPIGYVDRSAAPVSQASAARTWSFSRACPSGHTHPVRTAAGEGGGGRRCPRCSSHSGCQVPHPMKLLYTVSILVYYTVLQD